MGKVKQKARKTSRVSVAFDSQTFELLSMLAFLRGMTVSSLISGMVDSRRNAITREVEQKLDEFRVSQRRDGSEGEATDG